MAMLDLFSLVRGGPQAHNVRVLAEKDGLLLADQAIPWNADAALVQAGVQLPLSASRTLQDFSLFLAGERQAQRPEEIVPGHDGREVTVRFRLRTPPRTTAAEVFYKHKILAQVALPILSRADFLRKVALDMPTVGVRLGEHCVPCATYVATQCQGLLATAVLRAGHALVSLADMGLQVEVRGESGVLGRVPIHLTAAQKTARQALIAVVPPRPRRIGQWQVRWLLGEQELGLQAVHAISKPQFLRSLRVAGARFVLTDVQGRMEVAPFLPEKRDGIARIGPLFLVSSTEPGMAGLAPFQVHVKVRGGLGTPMLDQQELLVTDGPQPWLPGTLAAADLEQALSFELRGPRGLLGRLPLTTAPQATFTAEGGFQPPEDFAWSPGAEEKFQEKLAQLLGEG